MGNQQREGKVPKVVPITVMQLHRNAVYAAVQSFHQELNHYVATDMMYHSEVGIVSYLAS